MDIQELKEEQDFFPAIITIPNIRDWLKTHDIEQVESKEDEGYTILLHVCYNLLDDYNKYEDNSIDDHWQKIYYKPKSEGETYLDVIEFLINQGANVNTSFYADFISHSIYITPFTEIIKHYSNIKESTKIIKIIKLLLDKGSNIYYTIAIDEKKYVTNFLNKSWELNMKVYRLIINKWTDDGDIPLISLIQNKRPPFEDKLAAFKFILDHNSNPEKETLYNDNTLLHYILRDDPRIEYLKLLSRYNMDYNAKNDNGRSPIFELFTYKYYNTEDEIKCLKFLLKQGADINLQNNYGDTVLHELAEGDYLRTTRPLRDFIKNKTKMLKFLLEHDADPNIKGYGGRSVLNLFIYTKYTTRKQIKLLLDYGAKVDFYIPEEIVFYDRQDIAIKDFVAREELKTIQEISEYTGLPDVISSLINQVISPFSPFKI